MSQGLSKVLIFLEETVIELLFEFGVSPFQSWFFIEHLDKVRNVIVWKIKCVGVQGKNKNNPLLHSISRRKKSYRVFSIGLQSLAKWWNQDKVCILIETKFI